LFDFMRIVLDSVLLPESTPEIPVYHRGQNSA